jgi:hypothetical protein
LYSSSLIVDSSALRLRSSERPLTERSRRGTWPEVTQKSAEVFQAGRSTGMKMISYFIIKRSEILLRLSPFRGQLPVAFRFGPHNVAEQRSRRGEPCVRPGFAARGTSTNSKAGEYKIRPYAKSVERAGLRAFCRQQGPYRTMPARSCE